MQVSVVSFNGTNINDTTNFETSIVKEQPMAPATNPIWVSRAGAWPILAGKDFQGEVINLTLTCKGNYNSQLETVIKLFATSDETPRQLIIADTANSNKQYYKYCSCFQISEQDGTTVVLSLAVDDPVWQSVTQNSSTWTIASTDSSSDWTKTVTANGNDDSWPIFEVVPTSYISSGWIYNKFVEIIPTSANPWPNRPVDITGGGWDTATLVSGGKMQADGDDIRVYQDGVEIDYWFGTGSNAINQAATKIFCNLNMSAVYTLTLKTAIASTDTVTEIEFNYTIDNKNKITAMPATGRLKINSEEFTYSAKTVTATKLAVTVQNRAVRNTSAGTHAANASISFIPFDINVLYGNSSATAPDIDNTRKPVIALTSTNASFIYTEFADLNNLRSGSWARQRLSVSAPALSQSTLYTGINNAGDSWPAPVAGMLIRSYQKNGNWKPETASFQWIAPFLDTVSTVSFSGEQFQTNASWPATAALQGSTDGNAFATIKNISAEASTDYGTWQNWSYATTDLTIPANTTYLRFYFAGTVKAAANNITAFGPTAITVGLSNPPTVTMRAEQQQAHFDVTLQNATTGETLQVKYPLQTNETLYIDTDPDFPTVKYQGRIVNGAMRANTIRSSPLKMQSGSNVFNMIANQSGNLTITIKWRDRMLYL